MAAIFDKTLSTAPPHQKFIDEILEPYRQSLGWRFSNYRNYAQRICRYALGMAADRASDLWQVFAIASAFHKLGRFTDYTLDYVPRSRGFATAWLIANRCEALSPIVDDMIDSHVAWLGRPGDANSPTEIFRRAVFIETSNGNLTFGFAGGRIAAIGSEFPPVAYNYFPLYDFLDRLFTRPLQLFPAFKWRPTPVAKQP